MYLHLSILFLILIIIGTLLTLVLFNFDTRAIRESGLDKKIAMWIPFAILFLLVLYVGTIARFVVFAIILAMSIYEFWKVIRKEKSIKRFLLAYIFLFVFSFVHLGLIRFITPESIAILTYIIVGTVVSDVCGFFFGKFFGYHKLPEIFNKNKSFEGVLGQVVGALIGIVLVRHFVLHTGALSLFLPVGIGAALGDLGNSRAKKIAGIRNWSSFIPGHGGFIDRFCSLAGSSILAFYFILVFLR